MNCKPGEMAIVRGSLHNDGKIATCIKLHPPMTDMTRPQLGPVWETDAEFVWSNGIGQTGMTRFMPDRHLHPIRDPGDDAVDESKAWLPPVPQEVTA